MSATMRAAGCGVEPILRPGGPVGPDQQAEREQREERIAGVKPLRPNVPIRRSRRPGAEGTTWLAITSTVAAIRSAMQEASGLRQAQAVSNRRRGRSCHSRRA